MKLRTWLMIAFLVLMLLPLAAGAIFYQMIGRLDAERSFSDYMQASERIARAEIVLGRPELYRRSAELGYAELEGIADDAFRIELLSPEGMLLYSSMPGSGSEYSITPTSTRNLYAQLYELRIHPRSYVKKVPVFENGEMVGLYEITAARSGWEESVRERTHLVAWVLGGFILLLFLIMLVLLRRKLIRPMVMLTGQMDAFAAGRKVPEADYRSGDEMGRLMRHFDYMRRTIEASRMELSKQQEEKAFMISALSHDLKTPLTSIRAYAEELENRRLDEREEQEYLRHLIAQADRMRDMLSDLNLYASLESGEVEKQRVQVEQEEFFEMLLDGYEALASSQDIVLETEVSVPGGNLSVNPPLMMRMMDNLVGNAVRHTPSGGRVHLGAVLSDRPLPAWVFPPFVTKVEELCGNEESVLLLIQNEGAAVPEERQNRLFEPFYQGDASRQWAGAGSFGLGLTIANRIIKHHGGTIAFFSQEPYGTLIVCRLDGTNKKRNPTLIDP